MELGDTHKMFKTNKKCGIHGSNANNKCTNSTKMLSPITNGGQESKMQPMARKPTIMYAITARHTTRTGGRGVRIPVQLPLGTVAGLPCERPRVSDEGTQPNTAIDHRDSQ